MEIQRLEIQRLEIWMEMHMEMHMEMDRQRLPRRPSAGPSAAGLIRETRLPSHSASDPPTLVIYGTSVNGTSGS
jgi:hypothetical protein